MAVTVLSKFWTMFIASIALAFASAVVPYLIDPNDSTLVMRLVFPFCVAWGVLVFIAMMRFKWRGLWLLLGAPLAFWWPILFAGIASACAHNVRACP
jgi:hypothetical protein